MEINVSKVMQVYSGQAGKCGCGCSGQYHVAAAFMAEVAKSNGYPVDPNTVNNSQITRVCNIISKAVNATADENGEYVQAKVGNRVYVAYFVKE
jgi:hypothetical protein